MDEVEVTSWEEIADNAEIVEKQFRNLRLQKDFERSENGDITGFRAGGSIDKIILDSTQEENLRSQYSPPEPKMTILTRPKSVDHRKIHLSSASSSTSAFAPEAASSNSSSFNNHMVNNNGNPKGIQKSFEQREKEYAEARKRILGEVKFEEEEAEAALEAKLSPAEILKLKVAQAMNGQDVSAASLLKSIAISESTILGQLAAVNNGPGNNGTGNPVNNNTNNIKIMTNNNSNNNIINNEQSHHLHNNHHHLQGQGHQFHPNILQHGQQQQQQQQQHQNPHQKFSPESISNHHIHQNHKNINLNNNSKGKGGRNKKHHGGHRSNSSNSSNSSSGSNSSSSNNQSPRTDPPLSKSDAQHLIRQPRGPDGSVGFNLRR